MIFSRKIAAVILSLVCASAALAETRFIIEEPAADELRTGIGLISGWAVSDVGIESVEAFLDGSSIGKIPYGGTRGDVGKTHASYPDADNSGWAAKWNYSLMQPGEHTLRIEVTDVKGRRISKQRTFFTGGFKSTFLSEVEDMDTSRISLLNLRNREILIKGARVEGEDVDIRLVWNKATQQFLIADIDYQVPVAAKNKAPTVQAGSNKTVTPSSNVSLSGNGSDSDGSIVSWEWRQVSGPRVNLANTSNRNISFQVPNAVGDVVMELIATDDAGGSGSDRVMVSIRQASSGSNSGGDPGTSGSASGEKLSGMLGAVNAARSQGRYCGNTWYPGRPALRWADSLATAALNHSLDMAEQGYFSHTSLNGTSMSSRVRRHWSGGWVGENLAASTINRSAAYLVELWLQSPGHCSLIMHRNMTHVGIATARNPDTDFDFSHFWTMNFGG